MRCLIVTGTDTGIGKTVTSAAICAIAGLHGNEVAYVKPIQTGIATDEPDDVSTIRALTGQQRVTDLVRLDEPLAPESAGLRADIALPTVSELAARTYKYATGADLLVVEGAGGIAVRLDLDASTLIGLGLSLGDRDNDVSYVVVTSLRLGTLNHTELTVAAIRQSGQHVAGLVVGSIPAQLGLAEASNVVDLPRVTRTPLLGAIPAGAGRLSAPEFSAQASQWLDLSTVLPA